MWLWKHGDQLQHGHRNCVHLWITKFHMKTVHWSISICVIIQKMVTIVVSKQWPFLFLIDLMLYSWIILLSNGTIFYLNNSSFLSGTFVLTNCWVFRGEKKILSFLILCKMNWMMGRFVWLAGWFSHLVETIDNLCVYRIQLVQMKKKANDLNRVRKIIKWRWVQSNKHTTEVINKGAISLICTV